MNIPITPSASSSTDPCVVLDSAIETQFYQPPTGAVEIYVAPVISPEVLRVESAVAGVARYHIDNTGTGASTVETAIRRAILHTKLHTEAIFAPRVWDGWLMITVKARLYSILHQERISDLRPASLADIDPGLASKLEPESMERVEHYMEMLKEGRDIDTPLYITGDALRQVGGNPFVAPHCSIWMLDGARRILAHALNHDEWVTLKLIITQEQYANLLRDKDRAPVRSQIESLQWFRNYQTIPLVGLTGLRTSARFDLMNTSLLRDKRVLDFGCNLGQASLKAAQAGALEVIGMDVMPDTLAAARAVHALCPLPNLSYRQVDFNDPNFPLLVDQIAPGQVDYSFFFSVYRTQELEQRDMLFLYILQKSKLGVFFEGHGDPAIDSMEFYAALFQEFEVEGQFLGYSEDGRRPLFFIDRSGAKRPHVMIPPIIPAPRAPRAFAFGPVP